MSEEDVEVLRRAYQGYERAAAGEEDLAALIAAFSDPQIEWHPVQEPRPLHGREGVRKAIQGWFDAWSDVRIRPEKFSAVGETILVYVRVSGRGRTSGLEASEPFFHVWRMRDGKAIQFSEFSNESEALEAAGLSE